jgi:alpha-1,3-rhamnosyl/mannosyltransferase
MRVLIDATSLLLRSAGIKNYTFHWIEHLRAAAHVQGDEIRAFPFLDESVNLWHEGSVLAAPQTYPRLALLYLVNIAGASILDRLAHGAAIFHLSNQIRKAPKNFRVTATLHDLTCWLMPELHTAANVRADSHFAEHVLRKAHGLIAVSENTRQDAIRILGIAPEKIRVIYSGIAHAYFNATPTTRPRPYVLFLGTIEPRKNLDRLLDAWHLLRADLRAEYDLVIAGSAGWGSQRTLARLNSGVPGITYLGYVPESGLPGLTAGATLFVYPSLYEGFGFPVAQAMACGVPVLTSNTSCLPEIAAEGAMYVDPLSTVEISNALARALESPVIREHLAYEGRKRAQRYRWDACAAESLAFFHDVAA